MYKTYELSNGMRVVCEYIDYVHSVSVGVFVKNGSRHEKDDERGISHFIEHMLFKGTEGRSALRLAEEIDAVGGSINAYTTKEYTCYYARMLAENVDTAVDVLADMLQNSKLSDKDIELEKNVVYEEIAMYEDSPEDLVHEMLMEAAWGSESSLGASTLGSRETLEKFDSRKLREYMQKMYTPQNCVIAVAGKFDDSLAELLEARFGLWRRGEKNEITFSEKYENNILIRKKDIEQVHFCLGFPAFASENPKNYPLLAFNNAFGANMSSTLFQKVREEKGLVYSIFSYLSNYTDTGMLVVSASMKPENLDEVLSIVFEEAYAAKNTYFDEEKLYSCKQQLKGGYLLGLENVSSRMQTIGRSMLLVGRIKTPDEIIKKIEKINAENTHEYVNEVLDFASMSACAIGNVNFSEDIFDKYRKLYV